MGKNNNFNLFDGLVLMGNGWLPFSGGAVVLEHARWQHSRLLQLVPRC